MKTLKQTRKIPLIHKEQKKEEVNKLLFYIIYIHFRPVMFLTEDGV